MQMETARSGCDRKCKTGNRTEFYTPQLIFKTEDFGRKRWLGWWKYSPCNICNRNDYSL